MIQRVIPEECSRHGCNQPDAEASAIIEDRKIELLDYIQTICRDHLLWGRKLLKRSKASC